MVAAASASYPLLTPQPGWVEQDPGAWWQAVCHVVHEVFRHLAARRPGFSPREIQGVALSGQMNGAVFVDGDGEPLRPAILWLDHRSQAECDWANERAAGLLRDRALHVLNPVNTLAKVLWAREREPETYRVARWALIPKDWARFRLTGEFATDVSDASATAALDLFTRDWSEAILARLEVRRDLFPPVLESPAIAGTVTAAAAEETGLAPGTPVCAGAADMAALAVGTGVIRPGVASVGIGTAGHAITFAEQVGDAGFNQVWPMCHAVPGGYFWLGCSFTGGACMAWLRSSLGGAFEELAAEAEQAPPGCEGLFFLPWLEGAATPHPDASARGGWLGLTLRHTRAHLVRAVMEGVAFDLRRSLDCFAVLGLPLDELRLGEGGARSPLWRRIQADVFARDARVLRNEDASALGAALIAGVGTGLFESYDDACFRAVELGETVPFDPARAAVYEGAYRRYCGLYPALREWFRGYNAA